MSYSKRFTLNIYHPLKRFLKGVFVLFSVFLFSSCIVTKEEFLEEKGRLSALEALTLEIQQSQQLQKQSLRREIVEADRQIVRLKKIIDEIQSVFGQNTANLGLKTQEMISQIQRLNGELELVQKKLFELEERLAAVQTEQRITEVINKPKGEKTADKRPLPEIERPDNPNDFYRLIVKIWKADRFSDARLLADEFLKKWKKHSLSPAVRYAIAESYLDERNYQPAIVAYKKVLEHDAKSDRVPGALYKIGICFLSMGMNDEAKVFFEEVIVKHKKSEYAAKAKKKLKYTRQ